MGSYLFTCSITALTSFITFFNCFAQEDDTAVTLTTRHRLDSLYTELESLFDEKDDIAKLLLMADSLLAMETKKPHALIVRAAYISRILSAGRDFGVNQYGAVSGVTYMHPVGFYADARQYFNSGQTPAYYMTDLSAGYLWQPSSHWDVNFSHDFFFFNPTVDPIRFTGSAQTSTFLHGKYYDFGFEYAYLYGNEQAHRLFITGNGKFTLRTDGKINKIAFLPGAIAQWGSANVYFLRQEEPPLRSFYEVVEGGNYPQLGRGEYVFAGGLIRRGNFQALQTFLRRQKFTPEMIAEIFEAMEKRQIGTEEVFGLMNFSLAAPVSVYAGRWGLLFNYILNFPISLPGETFAYPVNSFFSVGLNYTLVW